MKKISICFFSLLISVFVYSQKVSLNLFIGTSNYEGDLQSNFFNFTQPGVAISGGASYQLSQRFVLRSGLSIAKVSADDKNNKTILAFRNLNFKSSIQEFQVAGEYYLLNLEDTRYSPYVFAGIALFHFNPYTKDTTGTKYFLQPLSTEGQGFYQNRKPYNLTQFAIPFGVGAKFAVSEKINIGVEFGMRKLFTDYLDDVSTTYIDPNLLEANRGEKALELAFRAAEISNTETYPTIFVKRGEPSNKDWYYFTGFTISYRLTNKNIINDGSAVSGKKKFRLGCPRF